MPSKAHGRYFLQMSLDEGKEENIWKFYKYHQNHGGNLQTPKTRPRHTPRLPQVRQRHQGTSPPGNTGLLGRVSHEVYAEEEGHNPTVVGAAAHHEHPAAGHHRSRADQRKWTEDEEEHRAGREARSYQKTRSASQPSQSAQ